MSMLCAIAMSLTLVLPVGAANINDLLALPRGSVYISTDRISLETQALINEFDGMTLDELNAFIDAQAAMLQDPSQQNRIDPVNTAKAAWLAAATVAEQKGYPLAATLVRFSVVELDYDEVNGAFSKAIKASAEYKNWLRKWIAFL